MLFNSLHFLGFFPIVVLVYFLLPRRVRWAWLLGASYYFYAAWRVEYLGLILISTLTDYTVGRRMGNIAERSRRTPYLLISLVVNLGILFTFKYFNFFNDSTRSLFALFGADYRLTNLDVLLPVGISFYTFQTLSYTIDIWRGRLEPERHLGRFALYIAFFPQLVAGPIERASRLLPQFRSAFTDAAVRFDSARVTSGLRLMLWGMFMKVVIADRLALYVNQVYNNPSDYVGLPVLLATYFFAFQIFCDFAGYSNIAIGAARVMGFDLMENFRQPYTSPSVAEFWRRWHISLSTWFRDYVYIPLGGNRVGRARWYTNLFLVFLVSGLWHGAAWTFVIWGALHGLYVVLGAALGSVALWGTRRDEAASGGSPGRQSVPAWLAVFATFHAVAFAWIFFRASSLANATLIITQLVQMQPPTLNALVAPWLATATNPLFEMLLALGLIVLLESVQWIARRTSDQADAEARGVIRDASAVDVAERRFLQSPVGLRWAAYLFLAVSILNLGIAEESPFIYFQF